MLGFLLAIILSLLQFPVWFVWKGEFLEDDDTLIVWYIEACDGWAEDNWEGRCAKWSRMRDKIWRLKVK